MGDPSPSRIALTPAEGDGHIAIVDADHATAERRAEAGNLVVEDSKVERERERGGGEERGKRGGREGEEGEKGIVSLLANAYWMGTTTR